MFPTMSRFNTCRITMQNLPFITAPAVIRSSDGQAVPVPVEFYSNGTLSFITLRKDTYVVCPIILVDNLPSSTSSSTVNVRGNVNDAEAEVFVEVNGTSYRVTDFDTITGNFSQDVTLRTGTNTIVVKAVNESMCYGSMSSQVYSINCTYSAYEYDEDDDYYDDDEGYSGGAPGGSQGDIFKDDQKKEPVVQEDGTVKVTVTSTKESGEAVASAKLDNETFKAAIVMAEADESGRREVKVSVECPDDTSTCEIDLPRLSVASGEPDDVLVPETGFATVELPGNMFTGRSLGANQDVTLSITKLQNTDLEGPLKDAVGSRPVIEIGINNRRQKALFQQPRGAGEDIHTIYAYGGRTEGSRTHRSVVYRRIRQYTFSTQRKVRPRNRNGHFLRYPFQQVCHSLYQEDLRRHPVVSSQKGNRGSCIQGDNKRQIRKHICPV
jgi:hypothetical protein